MKRPTHATVRRELRKIIARNVGDRGRILSPAGLLAGVQALLRRMEGR